MSVTGAIGGNIREECGFAAAGIAEKEDGDGRWIRRRVWRFELHEMEGGLIVKAVVSKDSSNLLSISAASLPLWESLCCSSEKHKVP